MKRQHIVHDPQQLRSSLKSLHEQLGRQKDPHDYIHGLLEKTCQTLGLRIRCNPDGDGNCFFEAVVDQMSRFPDESWASTFKTAQELRDSLVRFLKAKPKLKGPDGDIKLENFILGTTWEFYLRSMARNGHWADHVVVVAAAHMLGRDIHIITSSPQGQQDHNCLTVAGEQNGHKKDALFLGHVWENHYVSLEPIDGGPGAAVAQEEGNAHHSYPRGTSEAEGGRVVMVRSGVSSDEDMDKRINGLPSYLDQHGHYDAAILHAPQDSDMAEDIKDQIQKNVKLKNNEIPEIILIEDDPDHEVSVRVRSVILCSEEIIQRSTFVFMLLTKNFDDDALTRIRKDASIMQSIQKVKSLDLIVPLFSQEKSACTYNIPLCLRTLNGIDVHNLNKKIFRKFERVLNTRYKEKKEREREEKIKRNRYIKENMEKMAKGNTEDHKYSEPPCRKSAGIIVQESSKVQMTSESTVKEDKETHELLRQGTDRTVSDAREGDTCRVSPNVLRPDDLGVSSQVPNKPGGLHPRTVTSTEETADVTQVKMLRQQSSVYEDGGGTPTTPGSQNLFGSPPDHLCQPGTDAPINQGVMTVNQSQAPPHGAQNLPPFIRDESTRPQYPPTLIRQDVSRPQYPPTLIRQEGTRPQGNQAARQESANTGSLQQLPLWPDPGQWEGNVMERRSIPAEHDDTSTVRWPGTAAHIASRYGHQDEISGQADIDRTARRVSEITLHGDRDRVASAYGDHNQRQNFFPSMQVVTEAESSSLPLPVHYGGDFTGPASSSSSRGGGPGVHRTGSTAACVGPSEISDTTVNSDLGIRGGESVEREYGQGHGSSNNGRDNTSGSRGEVHGWALPVGPEATAHGGNSNLNHNARPLHWSRGVQGELQPLGHQSCVHINNSNQSQSVHKGHQEQNGSSVPGVPQLCASDQSEARNQSQELGLGSSDLRLNLVQLQEQVGEGQPLSGLAVQSPSAANAADGQVSFPSGFTPSLVSLVFGTRSSIGACHDMSATLNSPTGEQKSGGHDEDLD